MSDNEKKEEPHYLGLIRREDKPKLQRPRPKQRVPVVVHTPEELEDVANQIDAILKAHNLQLQTGEGLEEVWLEGCNKVGDLIFSRDLQPEKPTLFNWEEIK